MAHPVTESYLQKAKLLRPKSYFYALNFKLLCDFCYIPANERMALGFNVPQKG